MTASTTTSAKAADAESSQAAPNEPSMEDILASIRRIIAEDQSNSLGRAGLTRRTAVAQPVPPAPDVSAETASADPVEHHAVTNLAEPASDAAPEPILVEETQEDVLRASYYPALSDPEPFADTETEIFEKETVPVEDSYGLHEAGLTHGPMEARGPSVRDDHEEVEALVSPVAGASITSSFQALAESVMLQDPGMVERLTRESLRPMLKVWLDDHLPSIVERLVRSEIERVARGGRSRD